MTDIVERLRHSPRQIDSCQCHNLTREAAAEIERLRMEATVNKAFAQVLCRQVDEYKTEIHRLRDSK